tara:strand:+ start:131 stop:637 length:507 start_codon:yes stop_codon:yes gene_type:complete
MVILGIDPGLRNTGFGVIELKKNLVTYISSGTVSSQSNDTNADRLKDIFMGVTEVIRSYEPKYAVMEKVFVNTNPKTTLALGQARGASLTAIALEKIPLLELSSNEIKKSVVGNGHATKSQMQFMVKNLLNLNKEVCQDASDALASAITLSHRLKLRHHDQPNFGNNY